MYIPPNAQPLNKLTTLPQIRLGLQGMPGNGKTWSALTFPNPIVCDFDRGLGAHVGRSDVHEIPFYDGKFCDSIVRRDGITTPPNRRDAFKKWLMTEALKLTAEQTLVIDGSTGIQNAFEMQYNLNPVVTKSGQIDDYAVWRQKVEYFGEIMESIRMLSCHVVYICHETPDRDKKGELNGLVRPLLTGQFADQLASHFTDFFRVHAIAKPSAEQMSKFRDWLKIDEPTCKEWLQTGTPQTIYLWQTQADEIAKCKTSSLVNAPKFILADFRMFEKYRRKISV